MEREGNLDVLPMFQEAIRVVREVSQKHSFDCQVLGAPSVSMMSTSEVLSKLNEKKTNAKMRIDSKPLQA